MHTTAEEPAPEHDESAAEAAVRRSWAGVAALACAAFIFNTTEFIPIAMLSDIGASFALPATRIGVMMTVYAWIVALASLPLMLLTRRWERRGLLLFVFALFVLGHLVSVLAPRFEVLLASRVLVALAHALFWSVTASLAVRIAPKGRQHKALGLLVMGTTLAMVLGIPLGKMLGQSAGWRVSFAAIGAGALAVGLILAKRLPRLPSRNSGSLASLPSLLARPVVRMLYVLTALAVSAHFTAYSYIEPFALQHAKLSPAQVTILLLGCGSAGFIGSYLFGRLFARHAKLLLAGSAAVMLSAMLLLLPLAAMPWVLYALCLYWGVGIIVLSLSMQAKVLEAAPDASDLAMALFSGLYNIGIGAGALLGRYAAAHLGIANIGFAGAALALPALLLILLLIRHPDFSRGEAA